MGSLIGIKALNKTCLFKGSIKFFVVFLKLLSYTVNVKAQVRDLPKMGISQYPTSS